MAEIKDVLVERVKELQQMYKDIPAGFIGNSMIQLDLDFAKKAIVEDNLPNMLIALKKLGLNK